MANLRELTMSPRKLIIPPDMQRLFAQESDGELDPQDLAVIDEFWDSWTDEELDAWQTEQDAILTESETTDAD